MVTVFVSAGLCPHAEKHLTSKFTCKKRRKEQGGGEDQKVNKALFCFSILEMSRSRGHSKQLPATCTCHRYIRLLILGTACSESLSFFQYLHLTPVALWALFKGPCVAMV